MIPVQPGWIIKHADPTNDDPDYYFLAGWKGEQPVISLNQGIAEWQTVHGEDPWVLGVIDITHGFEYAVWPKGLEQSAIH